MVKRNQTRLSLQLSILSDNQRRRTDFQQHRNTAFCADQIAELSNGETIETVVTFDGESAPPLRCSLLFPNKEVFREMRYKPIVYSEDLNASMLENIKEMKVIARRRYKNLIKDLLCAITMKLVKLL